MEHDWNEKCRLKFPEHHKSAGQKNDDLAKSLDELNLTEYDLEKIVQSAFEKAQKNVTSVNMTELLTKCNVYSLPQISQFMKNNLNATSSKMIDYTKCDYSSDDTDEDGFSDDENDSEMCEGDD